MATTEHLGQARPAARTRREAQADVAADLGLATCSWRALGTSAQVVVSDPVALAAARRAVERVLSGFDLAASRFRPDSELGRLNAAGGTWQEASPLFLQALRVALDAARWTDGLVDPTLGAALVGLGYDRTFRLVPAEGPALTLGRPAVTGWQAVELDEPGSRVRLPAGVLLDLGATAKSLASDLAAAAARLATGAAVLVSLGGDVAVAGPAPGAGWPVLVTDVADPELPADPEHDGGQTVLVASGGLATSSTTARRWRRGGSWLHHLVDPRSGLPAAGPWRTVSTTATTCVLANTASTAAVVLGADGPGWLRARGIAARLVAHDGTVVRTGGWP